MISVQPRDDVHLHSIVVRDRDVGRLFDRDNHLPLCSVPVVQGVLNVQHAQVCRLISHTNGSLTVSESEPHIGKRVVQVFFAPHYRVEWEGVVRHVKSRTRVRPVD